MFVPEREPNGAPNQAAWVASSFQDGCLAFCVPSGVTSFQGYGMGSYPYFDQGVAAYRSVDVMTYP
jgi:hypothetical protein